MGEKPTEADEAQKNWLASNFREGESAAESASGPEIQPARPESPAPDVGAAASARPGAPLKGVDVR